MIDLSSSWPRRAKSLLLFIGVPGAIAAVEGCSLLYDLKATQCTVDSDCTAIAEGLVCGPNLVCKVDDSGCATHDDCLNRPDNIGESACIKDQGKTRGQCITLKTTECSQLLPLEPDAVLNELKNGEPIIFGVFTSVQLDVNLYNYDLAVSEFQAKNNGLPTQGGTRPIIMVACNGDPKANKIDFEDSLDRSIDHLIELHVPGIASDLGADDLKRIFEEKGRAAKIFFMSSQESDSSLNTLPDDGLMWQDLPGGTSIGKAYKPVVNRTITYLQNQGVMTSTDTVRIGQVTAPDINLLADISATVQSDDDGITFNGMSATRNLLSSPSNFLTLSAPSHEADSTADLSSQIESLLVFKPHIIISAGSTEFLTQVIPGLENQWDSRVPGQPHPFYILSPWQYNRSSLTTAITNFPSVRTRMLGINAPAAQDQRLYDQYISAFSTKYPSLTDKLGRENYYDAAYYLLYAAAAAIPTLTDGTSMVTGMSRLLTGESHNVGTLDMAAALQALARGPITLNGTDGPPDFNVVTGGRDGIGDVWCVDASKTTQSDVLRYQSSDGTMAGTFPCFPNY